MRYVATLVCFCVLMAAGAPLSAQEQSTDGGEIPLRQISKYFSDLTTAQARFRQFNDDGTISTGDLFIKRPGRMRFEYDPPESTVVIAGSSTVVIYDTKSNQPPETYPLRRTPLALILNRKVDLDRSDMVVAHTADATYTFVTAQDPENPEYGSIQMAFSDEPLSLRGWTINDANGGQTQVLLEEFDRGMTLSNRLFDVSRQTLGANR